MVSEGEAIEPGEHDNLVVKPDDVSSKPVKHGEYDNLEVKPEDI